MRNVQRGLARDLAVRRCVISLTYVLGSRLILSSRPDLRLLYCVQTHLWTNQDAAPMPSASSIRLPRLRTLVTAELEVDDEMDTSFPNHDFASLEGLALRSSLPRSLRIGTSTGRAAGQATTGN